MPTSYTDPVMDGSITELRDYALRCARAFGALARMRDDRLDAHIPKFEPEAFYVRRITALQKHLAMLQAMGPMDAQRAAQQWYSEAMARWVSRCDEIAIRRVRLQSMAEKVEAWAPPTGHHRDLKKFMLSQLQETMEFDCDPDLHPRMPLRKRWPEWLKWRLEVTKMRLAQAARSYDEEQERVHNANTWVSALQKSLEG